MEGDFVRVLYILAVRQAENIIAFHGSEADFKIIQGHCFADKLERHVLGPWRCARFRTTRMGDARLLHSLFPAHNARISVCTLMRHQLHMLRMLLLHSGGLARIMMSQMNLYMTGCGCG